MGKANLPCAGSDARMPSEHLRVGVYTDKPLFPSISEGKNPADVNAGGKDKAGRERDHLGK